MAKLMELQSGDRFGRLVVLRKGGGRMINEEAIKYLKLFHGYDLPIQEAFDMAIEALKETQWIPCSERLPKDKQVVLITNGKRNVRCGQFRGTGFSNSDCNKWIWKNNIIETVIAWMPLPSPYKGEE